MDETSSRVEGPKEERDLLLQREQSSQSLPLRKFKLSSKKDFENLRVKPEKFNSFFFRIYFKKNFLDHPRFAFSVSKKVGNAVLRNKIKRSLRESIRLNSPLVPYDFLIIVNPNVFKDKKNLLNSLKDLRESLIKFLQNLELRDEK